MLVETTLFVGQFNLKKKKVETTINVFGQVDQT